MTKEREVANIIIDYYSAESMYISDEEAASIAAKWTTKYSILDTLSIAALAISDSNETHFTKIEIDKLREFYFPSKNFVERS